MTSNVKTAAGTASSGISYSDYVEHLRATDPKFQTDWDASEPQRAIAGALYAARIKAGLSQMDVAGKSGLDKAAISRIENAAGDLPNNLTIARFAEACGLTTKLLLVDERLVHSRRAKAGSVFAITIGAKPLGVATATKPKAAKARPDRAGAA